MQPTHRERPTSVSSRRLPTTALAILLVLQAITVVGIVTLSSVSTRGSLVDQFRGTLTLVSVDTTDRAEAYLDRAARTAQITADALEADLVPLTDAARLEEDLRLLVTSEPDLAAADDGLADGDFVYAGRDGALAADVAMYAAKAVGRNRVATPEGIHTRATWPEPTRRVAGRWLSPRTARAARRRPAALLLPRRRAPGR